MATINSRELIDQIIEHDGRYSDDPIAAMIVRYRNGFDGDICYGITYMSECNRDRYLTESPFVDNPIILWKNPRFDLEKEVHVEQDF